MLQSPTLGAHTHAHPCPWVWVGHGFDIKMGGHGLKQNILEGVIE